MPYLPRHQTQLQKADTGARDCGPRTGSMGVDWATKGVKVPGIDGLRDRMKTPGNQTTNVYDMDTGISTYDSPDELGGVFREVEYGRRSPGSIESFYQALKAGRFIQTCIMYKAVNRLQPALSGDPNFNGGHSLGIIGQKRRKDGTIVVLSFDSLYDGRRAEIPRGPQWLKRSTIVAGLQAFSGTQSWFGGVFQQAVPKGNSPATVDLEVIELQADANALRAFASTEQPFLRMLTEDKKLPAWVRNEALRRYTEGRSMVGEPVSDPGAEAEEGTPQNDDIPEASDGDIDDLANIAEEAEADEPDEGEG